MSGRVAVSVLLAVHNDLAFLPAAVQSVLGQTLDDFELVVIDDGSTDGAGEYLDSIADPRIRVIHNDRNRGLTASLNLGLGLCRGAYIARMDADDLCAPDRLEKQENYLREHPAAGIVGSSRRLIDAAGNLIAIAQATTTDLAIRWKALLGNPFAHPSVMLRKSLLDAHALRYDESFRTAQDYELWSRLLLHAQGENLAGPLISYRLRDGISRTSKPEQLANHDRIAQAACGRLLPEYPVTLHDVRQLRGRFGGFSVRDAAMDVADPFWVKKRAAMLECFAARYASSEGIEEFVASQRDRR